MNVTNAQLNFLPLEHYYRDRVFGVTLETDSTLVLNELQNFGAFFPCFEHQSYHLKNLTNSKRNSWLGRKLFDEHLAEYQSGDVYLVFDVLADVSLGKDLRDIDNKQYFFNTRGIQFSGGIGRYFGFFSSLRETQARFLDYQVKELRKGGFLEINPDGSYSQGSAFVSGGNRTKAFQGDAFDFAHVNGAFIFQPKKDIIFSFGNNPVFIGAGHRSLFYSDHSSMFPHLRISMKINKFINAELIYAQHLNLIRMELNTPGTERLFEKKGFTMKYINFNPHKSLQLSLFEGTTWLKDDVYNKGNVQPLYYNPIPLINPIVLGQKATKSNSILGVQAIWNPIRSLYFYSQLAFCDLGKEKPATQLGLRLSEPFKIRNLHLLVEANKIPDLAYQHQNARLNYINNNMSLAHPMGAGVNEILGRLSYEWRRIGVSAQCNVIKTLQNTQNQTNGIPLAPRPIPDNANFKDVVVGYAQFDLCYRFNKKSNLQLFTSIIYRQQRFSNSKSETFYFGFGLRTQLINRYFDL